MRWTVTDNIYAETWRQLLEYANLELTTDAIIRRHGPPRSTSQRTNYEKQATQARVCVLQAKEYFDAARSSSLFTSPNHAYYGAVALASLTLLIRGDGRSSLDFLRTNNKNNHHGLDFNTGCVAKTATKGLTLVEESRVEILNHGHFPNWYARLPATGRSFATVIQQLEFMGSKSTREIGHFFVAELSTLAGKKMVLIDLLKCLPDLTAELGRYEISMPRVRSICEVHADDAAGSQVFVWRLQGARSSADLDAVLEEFAIESRFQDQIAFNAPSSTDWSGGIVTISVPKGERIAFKWPDSRDTLNHHSISYGRTVDRHEVVDLYLIAYQLSMLSRYFPDIWVSCIESQCRAAKLIERALEIIVRKLPILTLSALLDDEVVISTHREPWTQ